MNKQKEEEINVLLKLDGLTEAEKLTGKSYKEDKATGAIGLGFQLQKNHMLNNLLEAVDDTKFSETIEEYLRKVQDFGFKIIYEEQFNTGRDKEFRTENFYILWLEEYSILMLIDTHYDHRNTSTIEYFWSPNESDGRKHLSTSDWVDEFFTPDLSSIMQYSEERPVWKSDRFRNMSYEQYLAIEKAWAVKKDAFKEKNNLRTVYDCHDDVREAAKITIKKLSDNGLFVKQWPERTRNKVSLNHYGDVNNERTFLHNRRLNKLPLEIRNCISNACKSNEINLQY